MLHPLDRGLSGDTGTSMTSPPRSVASRAGISDAERAAASTTATLSARLAMIRLRTGKCRAVGCVPGGISKTSSPVSTIICCNSLFSGE